VIYLVRVHLLRLVILTHLEMRVLVVRTPVAFLDGAVYPVIEILGTVLGEEI